MLLTLVSCTTHRVKVDDHSVKYVTNYNIAGKNNEPTPQYYPHQENPPAYRSSTTTQEIYQDPITDLSLIPPEPQRLARTYPNYPRGYAGAGVMPRNEQIRSMGYPPAPVFYFGAF